MAAGALVLPILLLTGVAAPAVAEPPTAAQSLKELGFPSDTEKRVLAGEMVDTTLASSSERDLAVGLAFLVDLTPAELEKQLAVNALVDHVDPTMIAFGALEGDGTTAALAALNLSDGEEEPVRGTYPTHLPSI
jgi:hypothetical protein